MDVVNNTSIETDMSVDNKGDGEDTVHYGLHAVSLAYGLVIGDTGGLAG